MNGRGRGWAHSSIQASQRVYTSTGASDPSPEKGRYRGNVLEGRPPDMASDIVRVPQDRISRENRWEEALLHLLGVTASCHPLFDTM